jgi:hypothetical protein
MGMIKFIIDSIYLLLHALEIHILLGLFSPHLTMAAGVSSA